MPEYGWWKSLRNRSSLPNSRKLGVEPRFSFSDMENSFCTNHLLPETWMIWPLHSSWLFQNDPSHRASFEALVMDNYLPCFRILSAYVPEDAVLPNTQVWHLLVKELEVVVLILIHNLWRGFFRYLQGLDLTQNWATVLLSFDQVKGPCFLNISLHSLDST